MDSAVDHLKQNAYLFVGFSSADMEVIAPAAVKVIVGRGEALCRRGEAGTSMFVVTAGAIEVRRTVGGKDVALATIKRGEACGEMAIVTGGLRTADLIAAEDSSVLEITRERLDEVLGDSPEVAAKLWHNLAVALAQRLASTNFLLAEYIEINQKLIEDDEFRKVYGRL